MGSSVQVGTEAGRVSLPWDRGRLPWLAAGIATTMVVFVATARIDRLEQPSAWYWGWTVFVVIFVPTVFFWSDLIYRSVLIVWTVGVALAFAGTFGYFWWPLVMLPFAWIGAWRPNTTHVLRGFAVLGGTAALSAITVPVATAIVPPVDRPGAVVVCLTADAPPDAAEQVVASFQPTPGPDRFKGGIDSVGVYRQYHSSVVISFDRYAPESDELEAITAAQAMPHVERAMRVDVSPWDSDSARDPCR